VTAKANMHKGKWSEYWEQAKAAGDMGNEKVSLALSCVIQTQRLCYIRALMLYCHMVEVYLHHSDREQMQLGKY